MAGWWGWLLKRIVSAILFASGTLRLGLSAVHAAAGVVQSYAGGLASRVLHKAEKPGLVAAAAYAIAVWFCGFQGTIYGELATIARHVPIFYQQAILKGTLDGIARTLFMNPPANRGDGLQAYLWLVVDISRLAGLICALLLVVGAALLAVAVIAAVAGWIAGGVGGLTFRLVAPRKRVTARFARWWEVLMLRRRDGMAFGHYGGAPLRLITDKHVLIMASTRSGKGVSLIIPHLLAYRGSAFILDPKGENARATGRQRARLNGKVSYLDPFGITDKPQARFNPLASFTPANMEAKSKQLAAALFATQQRDHWTGSAQQLLATFILYVFTAPEDAIPPAKKDLITVRQAMLGAMKESLETMQQSDAADGLLATLATSFLSTPPNEFGSIVSTALRETEILDNPAIAECLKASGDGEEVDFADWHRGTMTVFLCLAAPKFPVFNRWLRLVLTSALDEMTEQLNPPSMPVCFMLDELATLGHLEAVENAVGLAAGYGIQLINVFQDVAQMRDLYKGRWASFIGNAGVRAVFNFDDYDTAHYWSNFIGGQTIETTNRSFSAFGIIGGGSTGQSAQQLLSPDQLMLRYSAGRMLVLPQGSYPIEAERVPYFRDRRLEGLWDDPRGATPATMSSIAPVASLTGLPSPAE